MRSYDDGEAIQSFRRGDYTIPANYGGNAFTADEPPIIREAEVLSENEPSESPENRTEQTSCVLTHEEAQKKECDTDKKDVDGGLLRGLISRIERGFDFDDILLIGLIILLIRENKDSGSKNDETVILLAILLLSGF